MTAERNRGEPSRPGPAWWAAPVSTDSEARCNSEARAAARRRRAGESRIDRNLNSNPNFGPTTRKRGPAHPAGIQVPGGREARIPGRADSDAGKGLGAETDADGLENGRPGPAAGGARESQQAPSYALRLIVFVTLS